MYAFTDANGGYYQTEEESPAWAKGMTPCDVQPTEQPDPKLAIKAQIETLEAQQLLPRITREFMLASFEQAAAAAGIDPMINVGYAKLKEFDTQIAVLRDLLNQN